MIQETPQVSMIALGSAELMKGFSLIGFDTVIDATVEDLKRRIDYLLVNKRRALVIIEHYLAEQGRKILQPVLSEGGGIIVVEVPPITNPDDLVSVVSEKIKARLGESALETNNE